MLIRKSARPSPIAHGLTFILQENVIPLGGFPLLAVQKAPGILDMVLFRK
jgi:hypothetical protein